MAINNPTGGRGQPITDPGTAYISPDGSDTTGDGSPSKPYFTGQPAVNAGFLSFQIAYGHTVGDMDFRAVQTFGQFFVSIGGNGMGNGANVSSILFNPISAPVVRLIGAVGVNKISIKGNAGVDGSPNGTDGGQLYVYIDPTAKVIEQIDASGGDGFNDGQGGQNNGGNGGLVNITGCGYVQDAIANAGAAGGGQNGNPGMVGGCGFNIAGSFRPGPYM